MGETTEVAAAFADHVVKSNSQHAHHFVLGIAEGGARVAEGLDGFTEAIARETDILVKEGEKQVGLHV